MERCSSPFQQNIDATKPGEGLFKSLRSSIARRAAERQAFGWRRRMIHITKLSGGFVEWIDLFCDHHRVGAETAKCNYMLRSNPWRPSSSSSPRKCPNLVVWWAGMWVHESAYRIVIESRDSAVQRNLLLLASRSDPRPPSACLISSIRPPSGHQSESSAKNDTLNFTAN